MTASAQINIHHTLITDGNTSKHENKQARICMHTSITYWMAHNHKAVVEKLESCGRKQTGPSIKVWWGHNAQRTRTQGMDAYSDDCSW